MKKTLKLMGLCALAVLVLAGCKKNEQNGNMTFKATISQLNNNAKTEIGSGNWLVWNTGDQIKVYTADKTEANAANFTLATGIGQTQATFSGDLAESNAYYAFYPTTGVEVTGEGKFTLPVSGTQTFVDANFTTNTFPMCATTTDGDFEFHSPYGILGIPMKGTATIGSIVLTDSLGMSLEGYYEMKDVDTTFVGNSAAITLSFGEGLTLSADTAKTAYFVVPAGALSNGFKADVKGTDGNRIVLLETSTPNTITAETIHLMPEVPGVNAPAPAPTNPEGSINGLFSVSANNNKQVYFSKGNLQYIGSASTPYWKFADNQWDYFGTTTGQNSTNQNANRDLFGWGTSGWNNGNTYYMPYNTAVINFGGDHGYGYGPTNGTSYLYDLTGDYAEADWAWHNAISNGGDAVHQWRTLSKDEWNYVFNERTTTSGIRYAKAIVNNVKGIILLPDDWNTATYALNNTNTASADYASNNITATDWTDVLEDNGAVFLPAAGRRDQTDISYVNTYGYYWSSSHMPTKTGYAHCLRLSDTEFSVNYFYSREVGMSVRPVKDYN